MSSLPSKGILMQGINHGFTKKFYAIGVNFHKTDTQQRSKYSITKARIEETYQQSSPCLEHYLILSTCNRTEIYGFAPCEYVILAFLKSLSGATQEEIVAHTFIKEGDDAIKHLLTVASGLDSQIPGDYEIIGQIRNAFQLSKNLGRSNGYIEKVVNQAVLVSKTIKNTTAFSDGTVSVSYAVVQQVKEVMARTGLKKICVVGLGKMGHNTLKYLRQHAPDAEITLVNRDEKKLDEIASVNQLKAIPFSSLNEAVRESEIVIVATGVAEPILHLSQVEGTAVKYIFDLAMPRNVAADIYEYPAVKVFDVDKISATVTDTLDKRFAEIPKVKAIVQSKAQEFFDWQERRKNRTSAPAAYEQFNPHVIARSSHSHPRQFACFMADQCCDGKPDTAWLPLQAYSA
ncbi:MAG TPA: glutamyl-tRNA reductase [Cyclobacteriaceae bacterium]|nr:glutamyl-tRNA reductase [Cyclobacteriaceae bacterium]